MPILKPISGHGPSRGISRYFEKGGRALARGLLNLSYDERDAGALGAGSRVLRLGRREGHYARSLRHRHLLAVQTRASV